MSWRKSKGGSGSTNLSQMTKLGVVGSSGTPQVEEVTIPSTTDFKRSPLDVLKFTPGTQQIVTECAFNNADQTSFVADDEVVFDGTMHLKTAHSPTVTDEGDLGGGHMWSFVIDRTKYKVIESIAVT